MTSFLINCSLSSFRLATFFLTGVRLLHIPIVYASVEFSRQGDKKRNIVPGRGEIEKKLISRVMEGIGTGPPRESYGPQISSACFFIVLALLLSRDNKVCICATSIFKISLRRIMLFSMSLFESPRFIPERMVTG